jgi:hypothetical protein
MEKDRAEEVEVWSSAVNAAIVRMPGRRFPGVVIQGDSLSALLAHALSLVESLAGGRRQEAFNTAVYLANSLQGSIEHYERTLSERGLRLPYVRDPARSARRFRLPPDDAG